MDTLNLTDERIFFTIQGEGKYCGVPSVFIRLSGCNLRCMWLNPDGTYTKCDTPHSSYEPESNKVEIKDILKAVEKYDCQHVVVTGGEPFLQPNVTKLVEGLNEAGHLVTMETNGTIFRPTKAHCISMSPKLKTSTFNPGWDQDSKRTNWDSINEFVEENYPNIQFKFVINDQADLKEVLIFRERLKHYHGIYMDKQIWLMPQGISTEQFDQKSEWVVELCKEYGWNFTDRLHIRLYGNKKGV